MHLSVDVLVTKDWKLPLHCVPLAESFRKGKQAYTNREEPQEKSPHVLLMPVVIELKNKMEVKLLRLWKVLAYSLTPI